MPSEEAVFEALISWIKQDEKKRKDMLPKMLEFVRLPLLTPRYITDIVDSEVSKQINFFFFFFMYQIVMFSNHFNFKSTMHETATSTYCY